MEDKSPRELLEEARAEVEEVSVDEAHRLFTENAPTVFLDMRIRAGRGGLCKGLGLHQRGRSGDACPSPLAR